MTRQHLTLAALMALVALALMASFAAMAWRAIRPAVSPPKHLGTAVQTTTVRSVPGGVALDILVTPDQAWPDSLTLERQRLDGHFWDPKHELHEHSSGLVLHDTTVNGVRLRDGEGSDYAPLTVEGRKPLHITTVVRPYSGSAHPAAWLGPAVPRLDLRQHTITFADEPARCDVITGYTGPEQYVTMAPCPAGNPLTLTATPGKPVPGPRVEYR